MLIISETTMVGQQQNWALAELSLKVVDGEHWVFQSTCHPPDNSCLGNTSHFRIADTA